MILVPTRNVKVWAYCSYKSLWLCLISWYIPRVWQWSATANFQRNPWRTPSDSPFVCTKFQCWCQAVWHRSVMKKLHTYWLQIIGIMYDIYIYIHIIIYIILYIHINNYISYYIYVIICMRILYQLHSIWKYAPWTTSQGPVVFFLRSFRVQSTPNLQGVFSILVGASHGNVAVFFMLVGGAITILKNDGVRQWEGLHPIFYGTKTCLKPPPSMEFTWEKQ